MNLKNDIPLRNSLYGRHWPHRSILALIASLYSAIAYIFRVRGRHSAPIRGAKGSLLATCGLVSISVIVLLSAILTHNFQIGYVASYTSRDTSLPYPFSALWTGKDGSLLFWAWDPVGNAGLRAKRSTASVHTVALL